ncbi:LOW QUALITY PROTEIN: cystathionine beta-synthase, putative [Eimeria mitis]|uniref:cystathionine beta-synthase n=1 Tax=Eimeria mitis TaxID=44415 RepID=U6K7J4_9EIME|nr:LOW QUALITY PROTEIN: cystathionine beta-synthase, putative [Eimeria mitis]CDJ33970.1 cystathionine beta-synthase, putative [Eimeria mitis]
MKDRIARGMVLAAEAQGRLAPRAALIEPTSGNTGIGLAMVAAVRGYRSVAVMPMKMSAEKHRIMKALGSTILRTPTAAAWDDQNSHIALSLRLQEAMLAEQQREGSTAWGNKQRQQQHRQQQQQQQQQHKHGETSNGNSSTGSSSNSNSSSNNSSSSSTDRYHEQIACILDQYRNPANPLSHFFGTGTELLAQCSNKLDMVVICAGTGGSLTGVGRRIKAALPQCIVVGVDPEGSVLADPSCSTVKPYAVEGIGYDFVPTVLDRAAADCWCIVVGVDPEGSVLADPSCSTVKPYAVEGIGYDFVPTVLDRAAADCWVKTTDEESLLCSRLLLRTEGMLVGGSAGAALAGAIKAIEHYGWTQDPTKRIAFLLPDSSRNYTTKFISDEWMVAKGFLDAGILDRQYNDLGVLGLQSVPLPALSFVSAAASLKETAAVLLQSAQPFVVVVKPEAAAAAAERGGVDAGDIVGTVTDQTLLKAMGDFPSTAEVKEVVDTEIPIFRCIDTSLARVAQTLELYPFVLIQSNTGLVTSAVEAKKLLQAFIDQQPQTQT